MVSLVDAVYDKRGTSTNASFFVSKAMQGNSRALTLEPQKQVIPQTDKIIMASTLLADPPPKDLSYPNIM